jgi:effector-binding domain-containing protein
VTAGSPTVQVETVTPRILAAVRRKATSSEIHRVWGPALDLVWAFLAATPGLRSDGHNIFLYHHPARRGAPMDIDFGVEVTRTFDPAGEVVTTKTPSGEVAIAVHVGPYDRLRETHDAIHAWAAAQGRDFAGTSWEVYGDWTDDTSQLQTTVAYLLS